MGKVNVFDVAKWYASNNREVASETFNGHIKLQKLLYYSQAMYYAVFGEPLFDANIEAWERGPVVNKIHTDYRHNFKNNIDYSNNIDSSEVISILKTVNSIYGNKTSEELVNLTHSEEPWKELEEKVKMRLNPTISKEKIKEYYKPLKEIYDTYEGYDFDSEEAEFINSNIFVYNKNETELTDEDINKLWDFSKHEQNKSYFIYKDDDGSLVIY